MKNEEYSSVVLIRLLVAGGNPRIWGLSQRRPSLCLRVAFLGDDDDSDFNFLFFLFVFVFGFFFFFFWGLLLLLEMQIKI